MNSPKIKKIISENTHLFWHTPEDKKEDISPDFLVETILNYGSLDDIKNLINIMGIGQVSKVFSNSQDRKKLNYYPEIYNFFSLFFKKYAQRNI